MIETEAGAQPRALSFVFPWPGCAPAALGPRNWRSGGGGEVLRAAGACTCPAAVVIRGVSGMLVEAG